MSPGRLFAVAAVFLNQFTPKVYLTTVLSLWQMPAIVLPTEGRR